MTERERYRTRAYSYYLGDDNQKCVEEYGALLQRYPSDTASLNNMADCLSHLRNLPKAVEAVRHAADILPKRALYHANIALYSAYGRQALIRRSYRRNPRWLPPVRPIWPYITASTAKR